MNISIKSYQTSIPAKAPAQEGLRSENTTKSTTENTNSSTAATVSISSSAQARYIQSSAIERQTSMSQSELKSLYAKGQKDIYNFGHLIAGGSYNKDDLLPKTDDPARLTLGQKSLDWAIGLSQSPPKHLSNPFAGMARNCPLVSRRDLRAAGQRQRAAQCRLGRRRIDAKRSRGSAGPAGASADHGDLPHRQTG